MRHMKKYASILLALVMALALAVPALAANNDGSITVNGAIPNAEYKIYRILDLELGEGGNTTSPHSYTVATKWENLFKNNGNGLTYFDVAEANGKMYVTIKESYKDKDMRAFAEDALKFATANNVIEDSKTTAPAAAENESKSTVTFSNLPLGYYLVGSTGGALLALDSTNKAATITEKNDIPGVAKTVKPVDSDKYTHVTADGKETTVRVGDKVEFKIDVKVKKGAVGYVVTDTMDAGLKLDTTTPITIKRGDNDVAKDNYTLTQNDQGFVLTFADAYLKTLSDEIAKDSSMSEIVIVVTYQATVGANAATVDAVNNKVVLKYGEKHDLDGGEDNAKVKVYKIDLVKTDKDNKLLDKAEFELYEVGSTVENRSALHFTTSTVDDKTVYTVDPAGATTTIVVNGGVVRIAGLAAEKTYYLKETKAPEGYNALTDDVELKIVVTGDEQTVVDAVITDSIWQSGGLKVENKTGTELPATGGTGTKIFYVVGSVMALGAVVLLVTKRRMSSK